MAASCVLIRNKDNAIIHSFFLNIHICLSKYKNLHNYLLATYLLCPLTSKDPPLRPLADASVFYVCSLKEDTNIKVCFFVVEPKGLDTKSIPNHLFYKLFSLRNGINWIKWIIKQ